MTKDEKKYVLKKLKRAAVIAASAVTGLTAGGCATNNKKDDAVANNDIVFVEEQTEATTPVDTIETTTTTAFSPLNKDSNRKKSYDDDSVDSEYVETSYENDLVTTITSTKNSNKNDVVDDNTTSKTNSKTSTTTAKTNEKNPNTKIETNTKNPTTTAKVNENPTTTKPTTAKTTTTVTTTTTEAVTEPPVTEPEIVDYNINDICYDVNAFNYFADRLSVDLRTAGDGSFYPLIQFGSTYSNLRCEASYILALLNYGSINDDVIAEVLSQFSSDSINSCIDFAYNLGSYQADLNNRINFYAYACDQCKYAAEYVNNVQGNFFDGNIGAFVEDQIYNNNIDPLYSGSLSVRCFIAGYTSSYAFLDDYVNSLNDYDDYIHNRVLGNSFSIN